MLYKYETHSHTCETSKCATIPGAELARYYKSLGYTGLIVSDHFFNGNTTVPRDLPWEERVALFCAGYDAAKAEGDKIGLDVFFAWEYSFAGTDYLIYGLDRDWLLAHPDQLNWKLRDYMDKVREDGGLVIHAHPFREAGYIEQIRLTPWAVDGVEVINAAREPDTNRRAEWYARDYGLLMSAGSDNHSGKCRKLAGVYLPERIQHMRDFVRLLREGKHEIFYDRYEDGIRM